MTVSCSTITRVLVPSTSISGRKDASRLRVLDAQMRSRWGAVAWVAWYVLVAVAPLLLSLIQLDPGRGFWVNLSVSFGFVGLPLLGLQFALAARSVRVAQPTGVLPLLQFHREVSYLVLVLILAHPIILVLYDSSFRSLFDVVHAPLRAQLAIASVLALLLLVATSVWRTRMRLSYHAWQVLHATLAVCTVATALAHVLLIGYYVDQPWERALWIVYSLAFVWISLWVRVVKPLQRWRRRWRVAEVREQPGDSLTIVLELVHPDAYGPDGFQFDAGQFAWIMVGHSPFALTYHPFSFSSGAHSRTRVEFTIRSFGTFTAGLRRLKDGEHVYLDGRWGRFRVNPDPRVRIAMIAAGIGVTPMLSMLKTMADGGDRRECVLILGNRTEATIPGHADIEALQGSLNLRVVHVLSEPADGWAGESGRVGEQVLAASLPGSHEQWQFFLCGPSAMMDSAESWLARDRVAAEQFHSERLMMA